MNWKFPVSRASMAGLGSLAAAAPGGPDLPVAMFTSSRAARRRARARVATLAEVADGTYDLPLTTPVAPPPRRNALGTAQVGTFPTGIAVSPDGNRVYVANSGDHTVSVIDAENGSAPVTVPVDHAPYGIALTADGRKAYVANASGNSVSVIDTQTSTVAATIPVGAKPYGVAVRPGDGDVYVTNQADGSLTVIGAATSTIVVGGAPTGVAASPDGAQVYVVDNERNRLLVIDADEGKVAAVVTVGKRPAQVAVTPDGSHAFVTNAGSGSVSRIDLATATVTDTIAVSSHPIGVAVEADGRFAYVTALDDSLLSGTVTIIDTATGATSTTAAGAPYGVAADPAGDYAYVTDFHSHAVSLIGPATGAQPRRTDIPVRPETVRTITLDRDSRAVVADPDLARAFVIRSDDDAIDVIETSGEPVTVAVGAYPSALVLNRAATRAYVTNYEDGSVSVIDADPLSDACNTVVATLDVGQCWATGVVLSVDGSRAYAVDELNGRLSVIDTASGSPTHDTVVAAIEIGEPPAAVRIAPNGRWVYAINHFDYAVWAIHTATNRRVAIGVPAYPYRISLSPNGSRLYASLSDDGSTCVIDTDPASPTYHCVIARLRLGGHMPDPVFSTAGTRAYILKSGANAVAVVNTADSSVKDIAVGHYPLDLAISPDARRGYVANSLDDSVSVISCITDLAIATIPVGARPCRVVVSADGTRVLTVNSAANTVSVIDTAGAAVTATISVGRNPFDVAVSADGSHAFVHHRGGLSLVAL